MFGWKRDRGRMKQEIRLDVYFHGGGNDDKLEQILSKLDQLQKRTKNGRRTR
jgi:hypothetical protein